MAASSAVGGTDRKHSAPEPAGIAEAVADDTGGLPHHRKRDASAAGWLSGRSRRWPEEDSVAGGLAPAGRSWAGAPGTAVLGGWSGGRAGQYQEWACQNAQALQASP